MSMGAAIRVVMGVAMDVVMGAAMRVVMEVAMDVVMGAAIAVVMGGATGVASCRTLKERRGKRTGPTGEAGGGGLWMLLELHVLHARSTHPGAVRGACASACAWGGCVPQQPYVEHEAVLQIGPAAVRRAWACRAHGERLGGGVIG